jgi:hypothetical protein
MQNFKVISFYTDKYESHAIRFINSLKNHNIDYYVHKLDDKGSWKNNTNYKPIFIRDCLLKFEQPVLWIDSDAVVHSDLSYFNDLINKYDIAYHLRRSKELLSGTLWFDYNSISIRIIDEWIKYIQENSNIWDQYNLERALKNIQVRICYLSAEYCCISDLMRESGEVGSSCYIEHFQASRKFNENHPIFGKLKYMR